MAIPESAPANLALAINLPPERAIEYFRAKGMRISRSAADMATGAHARAFTVAGVLKAEALQDIRTALDDALANGKTYDQFVTTLKPQLKARGWWGIVHDPETGEVLPGRAMTPHRLRTVYQTNLQSSYMAGRYKSQLENADRRPYWMYVAILDNRTRPRHREMNGRVFRYDDAAWASVYPPNGYNCRCRVRAMTAEEFDAEGLALSQGEGNMEVVEIDTARRSAQTPRLVPVTGYRDPRSKELFTPDPGFDSNPGQGAFGVDIALARRVQDLKSPAVRSQVWQALNNSPRRLAQYHDWVQATLTTARPGHGTQVIGFVDEPVAAFIQQQTETAPVRVVAINEKRLVHADSAKHNEGGIALNRDQYDALPGIIAAPDAVYFDTKHRHFAYVRRLADGGVIYIALNAAENLKKTGRIDALVNAYRLPGTLDGAGRLLDQQRFVRMGAKR